MAEPAAIAPIPEFTVSPPLRRAMRNELQWVQQIHCGYAQQDDLKKEFNTELDAFIETVEKALHKVGYALKKSDMYKEAPPISIAYPKRLAGYAPSEEMPYVIRTLQAALEEKTGRKWPVAEDIFQIKQHRRAFGGMVAKQPFFASASAFKAGDARRLFIIADDVFDRGTTMAGLVSYIEHHGGQVLSTVVNRLKGQPLMDESPAINDYIAQSDHPEQLRAAIELGLNGGDPATLTGDAQALCRLAANFKKLGVDIHHLLEAEMCFLMPPGKKFDPEQCNHSLEYLAKGSAPYAVTEAEKQLLRRQVAQQAGQAQSK